MELRNAALGDVPMLVATGVVDHSTCAALKAALDKVFAAGYNVLFLDLSDVASIDGAGLSVLLSAAQTLRRGWLGLIGPNTDIRGLLESEGILTDPRIRVFETRQAARVVTGERAST